LSTADACAREAAWLGTTGDSLPPLPASAAGPFQVIQAYWPRTPATNQTGLYVLRGRLLHPRTASQRIRPRYEMRLRAVWPVIVAGTPLLETAQQNFDTAIDSLLARILGPLGDKSHGGRFESAAEDPRQVEVQFADPEQSMAQFKSLRADVIYTIDDYETSG
jgi:hypothetical protein